MNLFHSLRRKAEFANIVFVCAGPAVLDKPGKFDYTAIRKALCLQTTSSLPDQSRENDRSAWNSEAVIFSCVFYRHVPHPFLPRPGTSPGSKKPPCWYLAARRFLLLSYKSKNKSGISNRFSGRITNLFCSSPRIFQGGNLNRKRPCGIFHRTVFVDFNRHYLIIVSIDSSSYHCRAFIHTVLQ